VNHVVAHDEPRNESPSERKMLVGGWKRWTPVDIVHVHACPPLGSGTDPGREAQKPETLSSAERMMVVFNYRFNHNLQRPERLPAKNGRNPIGLSHLGRASSPLLPGANQPATNASPEALCHEPVATPSRPRARHGGLAQPCMRSFQRVVVCGVATRWRRSSPWHVADRTRPCPAQPDKSARSAATKASGWSIMTWW
jgi:hypothetical protein